MCCSLVCSQICLVMILCLSLLGVYCFTFLKRDDHTISNFRLWHMRFLPLCVGCFNRQVFSIYTTQPVSPHVYNSISFLLILKGFDNGLGLPIFVWTLSIVQEPSNLICSYMLFPHHSAILWKISLCVPLGVLFDFLNSEIWNSFCICNSWP